MTYANLPDGATTTSAGSDPAGNPEPGIAVKAPVAASMVNPETLAAARFVTYANLPEGSIPTLSGPEPVVKNGEPGIGVRKPEAGLTENAGTSPAFATYTNLPVGCTVTPSGKRDVAKGEPPTAVKAPVTGSIW